MNKKTERILSDISSIAEEKNKNIVIIGAGDEAMEYAFLLSKENSVTLIHPQSLGFPSSSDHDDKPARAEDSMGCEFVLKSMTSTEVGLSMILTEAPSGKERRLEADFVLLVGTKLPAEVFK
ncbi:hypothetical protein ACFLT9_14310 [Acidobacteriota bacterium]